MASVPLAPSRRRSKLVRWVALASRAVALLGILMLALIPPAAAQAAVQGVSIPPGVVRSNGLTYLKSSHIYKVADGVEIKLDAYKPQGDQIRPAVMWIHGGALIGGSRGEIFQFEIEQYLRAGLVVVSIDYRLAPETKLPTIVQDVEDAWKWIHAEGPSRLGIDPSRIGVIGSSAGGYLALVMGFRAEPKPRVIASFFGYGDILGDWLTEPSDHYNKQPAVTAAEARDAMNPGPISESFDPRRGAIYLRSRQTGSWPELVMGRDPLKSPEEFTRFLPVKNARPVGLPQF